MQITKCKIVMLLYVCVFHIMEVHDEKFTEIL